MQGREQGRPLNLGSEFMIFGVGVCPTGRGRSAGALGRRAFGSAPPALSELRLQLLAARSAGPRHPARHRRGARQSAQGKPFVTVRDVELRPGFHHRQIPKGAGQILIAQFALDARGERILPVYYGDNYVSLLPGESRRVSIDCPIAGETCTKIGVRGWNVVPEEVAVLR